MKFYVKETLFLANFLTQEIQENTKNSQESQNTTQDLEFLIEKQPRTTLNT